jgi:4a-hydroxytetrahydrobiopterin dehydratase
MGKPLEEAQLNTAAATLPNWKLDNGELVRWTTFADFNQAMEFVNRVAAFAEGANHHPDIDIRYNRVRLALVTHDAGGITQKDIDLARSIEADRS